MQLVIDGMVLYRARAGGGDIDWQSTYDVNTLPIPELVAVEIYRSPAEVPMEYGGPSAECGVVLFWTMRSMR